MALIDEDKRLVLVCYITDLAKWGDVAIHGEYTVGCNQFNPGIRRRPIILHQHNPLDTLTTTNILELHL